MKEKRRQGFIAYFFGCRLVSNRSKTSCYERSVATKAMGRESMMQAREVRSSVQSAGVQESNLRPPAFSSVAQGNNTEAVGAAIQRQSERIPIQDHHEEALDSAATHDKEVNIDMLCI